MIHICFIMANKMVLSSLPGEYKLVPAITTILKVGPSASEDRLLTRADPYGLLARNPRQNLYVVLTRVWRYILDINYEVMTKCLYSSWS